MVLSDIKASLIMVLRLDMKLKNTYFDSDLTAEKRYDSWWFCVKITFQESKLLTIKCVSNPYLIFVNSINSGASVKKID